MNNLVLECREVCKGYRDGNNRTEVLKGVNLELEKGSLLSIVGSSGSGKSTLLHILGTLDGASSGEVKINGVDVASLSRREQAEFRNRNLGFVYQFHHLLMEFDALENVAMPLLIQGLPAAEAKARAKEMLKRVGLEHRAGHTPAELSGGERQRVAIARALVTKPALVLADEPTGNLDKQNAANIYQLIRELNETVETSFIIVTHDLELAASLGRSATLDDGVLTVNEGEGLI